MRTADKYAGNTGVPYRVMKKRKKGKKKKKSNKVSGDCTVVRTGRKFTHARESVFTLHVSGVQ